MILDNLAWHKSEQAKASPAWVRVLPRYSPEPQPIELAFAKLKGYLRRVSVRTIDALWHAVGDILDPYAPDKRLNYAKAARYPWLDRYAQGRTASLSVLPTVSTGLGVHKQKAAVKRPICLG